MSAGTQIDFSKYETPTKESTPKIDFSKYDSGTTPQEHTAMDSVKDFASEFWKQVNPVAGIKGAAQLTAHPIESIKSDANARQDVYNQAEEAFKKGNYTEGAAHLLYAALPFVGPQLNAAGNQFLQGQYAKGAGASAGMGVAMAAPEAISELHPVQAVKNALTPAGAPAKLYESALKPSTTFSEAERAKLVQTGLQNEIPVTKGGLEKLGDLVDNLNDVTTKIIKEANNQGATVNKYSVAGRLGDTAKKFATQVNPEADLKAVAESGNEFLGAQPTNIPAGQAQAMKSGTYAQLRGKYGELGSATIEAQKSLARGIKEELIGQFPELKTLGQQEGALLQLQPILERAVNRIANHQIIGIGTPIAAGAAKAVTGSTGVGAVAGLMKAVLDDPMVKSRLAIALSRTGTTQVNALSRLGAYASALGNAANGGANADPQGGE
jgi:hypothetical protein